MLWITYSLLISCFVNIVRPTDEVKANRSRPNVVWCSYLDSRWSINERRHIEQVARNVSGDAGLKSLRMVFVEEDCSRGKGVLYPSTEMQYSCANLMRYAQDLEQNQQESSAMGTNSSHLDQEDNSTSYLVQTGPTCHYYKPFDMGIALRIYDYAHAVTTPSQYTVFSPNPSIQFNEPEKSGVAFITLAIHEDDENLVKSNFWNPIRNITNTTNEKIIASVALVLLYPGNNYFVNNLFCYPYLHRMLLYPPDNYISFMPTEDCYSVPNKCSSVQMGNESMLGQADIIVICGQEPLVTTFLDNLSRANHYKTQIIFIFVLNGAYLHYMTYLAKTNFTHSEDTAHGVHLSRMRFISLYEDQSRANDTNRNYNISTLTAYKDYNIFMMKTVMKWFMKMVVNYTRDQSSRSPDGSSDNMPPFHEYITLSYNDTKVQHEWKTFITEIVRREGGKGFTVKLVCQSPSPKDKCELPEGMEKTAPNKRSGVGPVVTFLIAAAVTLPVVGLIVMSVCCIWCRAGRAVSKSLYIPMTEINFNETDSTRENPENPESSVAKRMRRASVLRMSSQIKQQRLSQLSEEAIQPKSPIVGKYRSEPVFCRPIEASRSGIASRSPSKAETDEFTKFQGLRHSNVLRLYGLTNCDTGDYLTVLEYCSKGALTMVLREAKHSWQIKFSILNDIAAGMLYLHTTLQSASGRLTTYHCLVDGRFTVKVGLPLPRLIPDPATVTIGYRDLWASPERLRQRDLPLAKNMDVYSYGIVMHEVTFQKGPFYLEEIDKDNGGVELGLNLAGAGDDSELKRLDIKAQRIVPLIKERTVPPVRPTLEPLTDLENCDRELCDLMEECWAEQPQDRPEFTEIKERLDRLIVRCGFGRTVEDTNRRLASHTADLEEQAEQRAKQIVEAQGNLTNLCYRLFPFSVAKLLLDNEVVKTQEHKRVTIYFNDLVGFTNLCTTLGPSDIVQLLNDLFSKYDAISDNYIVYPLMRQGDAFTMVSGLPVSNSNHASEIAQAALQINEYVTYYENAELKNKLPANYKFQIRSGISSNTAKDRCVSGVIRAGTMPQYVVIGEVMQAASRMEATGKPSKIQISAETKKLLQKSKVLNFDVSERTESSRYGNVQLANDTITTYWLNGIRDVSDFPLFERLDEYVKKSKGDAVKSEKKKKES